MKSRFVWMVSALLACAALSGCGGSGKQGQSATRSYPVYTVGSGPGTEGIRVMLREGPWGKYVVVVHRAADRWGRVDVTLWVEREQIAILRDEMLGPWSIAEVVVELPGQPMLLSSKGKMTLVLVRGEQRLGVLAAVEPASPRGSRPTTKPQATPEVPQLELP